MVQVNIPQLMCVSLFAMAGISALSASGAEAHPHESVPPVTDAAGYTAYVYSGEGNYERASFLCDDAKGKSLIALTQFRNGKVKAIQRHQRTDLGRSQFDWIALVDPDAGMSQVRYTLQDATTGQARGTMNTVSPGAVADNPDAVVFPIVSSMEFDGTRTDCRSQHEAVFTGYLDDRTIAVQPSENGGFELLTWSMRAPEKDAEIIEGGSAERSDDGAVTYAFAQGHSVITLTVPKVDEWTGAKMKVESDRGETIEPFIHAYMTKI
ncbi:MAG: hypothetical protein QNJ15_08645 [Erythrobacter sp.]|nr:hypothetical protein [Erythrobacter sp.]